MSTITDSDYKNQAWKEITERWGRARKDGKWISTDQGTVLRNGKGKYTLEQIRTKEKRR